jgi:phosphoribosylanthranilate isomerase
LHLLDTAARGKYGGSGATWDWALAARRRSAVPQILSGGLTDTNVAAGIEAVRPYAVDVASGVESAPGVKDPERLRAFLAAARAPTPATAA